MFKKLLMVYLIISVSLLPIFKVSANAVVVKGVTYAVDLAAPTIFRYLASEVAIRSAIKAFDVSTAYYSAEAKVSNSKFYQFLKSKAALGVVAAVTVFTGLGYYFVDGEVYKDGSIPVADGDVAAQAGYLWQSSGHLGSNISEVANSICTSAGSFCENYSITAYSVNPSLETHRDITFYQSSNVIWTVKTASISACYSWPNNTAATCQDNYVEETPPSNPVDIEDAQASVIDGFSTLSDEDKLSLVADAEGKFDDDLYPDLVADNAPNMPDGETPIPNIGSELWNNANLIANGVAQSSNPDLDTYVPQDDWDTAYYLANTVANNNSDITDLNTVAEPVNPPDDVITTPVAVDLTSVEQRLDEANQLSSQTISELQKLNETSVETISAPNLNVSSSFWPMKYPDGLSGVLNSFIDDMSATPLFEWLSQFRLQLSAGSYPAFEVCFNEIASIDFGCYTLEADASIWLAIKSTFILFALIIARKVVFGG